MDVHTGRVDAIRSGPENAGRADHDTEIIPADGLTALSVEAALDLRVRTKGLGAIAPLCAAPHNVHDPRNHPPIIGPVVAALHPETAVARYEARHRHPASSGHSSQHPPEAVNDTSPITGNPD